MRTSISNMLGVLPPHYFDVTVSTVGENLAQLMFSVIMTGTAPSLNLFSLARSRILFVLSSWNDGHQLM